MQQPEINDYSGRTSIEAVARIISTSVEGLRMFLQLEGARIIQEIMQRHPKDKILQGRGIRALASGVDWPEDLQKLAKFNFPQLVKLTQDAIEQHSDSAWLTCAAFEGFYKFLPRLNRETEKIHFEEAEKTVRDY